MTRQFKAADYAATLEMKVRIGDVLPATHLVRFVEGILARLDMSSFYASYGEQGAPAYAPEVLLGILVYGYTTGVFSSRQLERATYESLPFIYIAGGLHPDHDTINTFRSRFLTEIGEIFVQVLLMAQATGLLQLGNISLDGSKIHADASKSQAVSYARALELEAQLRNEVAALMALAADCEAGKWPQGFDPAHEIRLRQEHLAGLDQAKAVLALVIVWARD